MIKGNDLDVGVEGPSRGSSWARVVLIWNVDNDDDSTKIVGSISVVASNSS